MKAWGRVELVASRGDEILHAAALCAEHKLGRVARCCTRLWHSNVNCQCTTTRRLSHRLLFEDIDYSITNIFIYMVYNNLQETFAGSSPHCGAAVY